MSTENTEANVADKLAQALRDAAQSLDTISRLAGRAYAGKDSDGEPIPTYMGQPDEIRAYAKARAGVASAALAAHESCAKACEAEKAQAAAPFGWMIEGAYYIWWGEFAEIDAKNEARRVGGTCRAFPIYLGEAPAAPASASEAPVAVPEGFALVPLRMTTAMQYVTEQEDWTWEDLLASAEAITEEQYGDIAAATSAPVAVRLTDEEMCDALRQCPQDVVENLRVRWLYATDFARVIERTLAARWGVKLEGGQG